jgi:hypothetical protein
MAAPRVFSVAGPLLGTTARTQTVSSDLGSVRLKGTASTTALDRDPSWTAPGTGGWTPDAPQGAYNPGGPFWRPY